MPVKIRLQRHGKKGKPFYWVVAADARAKRDGKFLEKLGIYDPNTNPATIELNVDGAVQWLKHGAQPTDTARKILSYKGALLKHHLMGGVQKGALTEEQAEEKFNAWVSEKEAAIQAKRDGLSKEDAEARSKALAAEKEVNEKRAAEAAAAAAPEVEEAQEPEATDIVVETPDTPQPDAANEDATPVAPVKEEAEIKADETAAEAPSVEEVIEKTDEEVKPADTGSKE
ncbi:30S ribosomal protein S16 [Maribacter sp. 2307ULW6-5]|uniref:30S ribosomal protein S16 n=1 Tax=Maribacter sp. 2307ULW6-5 TaxID=3386275 RepID=UPI0039BD8CB1